MRVYEAGRHMKMKIIIYSIGFTQKHVCCLYLYLEINELCMCV